MTVRANTPAESAAIRAATPGDAAAIREIYRYYVEHTAVTFDYETPSVEEFRRRIAATQEYYPYYVAEEGGAVLGYAYAGRFHPRAAYGWCAEMTVYLHPDARGRGLGRALYEALEAALEKMGVVNLYACISDPITPDEYLSADSPRFHAHMGYERIGEFHRCGFKFGRWYNMIWMEKLIGEHRADQPPVQPFPSVGRRSSTGLRQEPKK